MITAISLLKIRTKNIPKIGVFLRYSVISILTRLVWFDVIILHIDVNY